MSVAAPSSSLREVRPREDADGRWLERPGVGVYVHIPFCARRCHYCDFNTYEGLGHLHGAYVDALVREIERAPRWEEPAASVFFGGGTPTLLAPEALGRVLRALGSTVGLAGDAEVTVEANPETLDAPRLDGLLAAGFNRISIGVQSTAPPVLRALGREHSGDAALEALRAARTAGFANVNADLIFGSPWETDAEWRRSLDEVVDAAPDHVSAYALTVEEGTPLDTLVRTRRVPDVDPDVQAARHDVASEVLAAAGFRRYEISNWARPGKACRHNLLYWSAGDYMAFGAGAHGHRAGRRWWNVRLPRDYIAAVDERRSTEAGAEQLGDDERAGEALMLALRLHDGVEIAALARRVDPVSLERRLPRLRALADRGLVEVEGGRVRVATRSVLVANEALCQVL